MSSPDPKANDPARRPTGAIPAHWTVPAEVSASAVDRPLRSFADHNKGGGAGKIVVGLLVIVVGAAAGAAATGALDLGALGSQLGLGSAERGATGEPSASEGKAPTSVAEGKVAADGTPLKAEPMIPRPDNPALVDPQAPGNAPPEGQEAAPNGHEPGAPADSKAPKTEAPREPQVVQLDELPVRKKVKGLIKKGERYVRAGKYKSAAKVLERAAQLDPNYPQAQRSLGIARARLGDFDGARKAYTRYLELDPEAEDAADVRRILGQ